MSPRITLTNKYHKTTYPSLDPTRPELSAKGKTVIVTGGGTGIGAETAKYFAKAGASRIALLGRRQEPLIATKAEIERQSPNTKVQIFPTDVTDKAQVDLAVEEIASEGLIDVLISNAAVHCHMGGFTETTTENFLSGILTNVQIP